MNKLWILDSELDILICEADKWFPLETGGLLLGYIADNSEIIVTKITTSGPNSIHKKYKYFPDDVYDQEAVEKIFYDSKSIYNYLGDWHTHPNGTGFLSGDDKKTMRIISKSEEAILASPSMLILFGNKSSWKLCAYNLIKSKRKWLGLGYKYNNLQIKRGRRD